MSIGDPLNTNHDIDGVQQINIMSDDELTSPGNNGINGRERIASAKEFIKH